MDDAVDRIASAIARYWLKENLYCGLSVRMLAERTPELDPALIEEHVAAMEAEGHISSREVNGIRWVYPREGLLRRFDDSDESLVGRYTKMARMGGSQIKTLFFRRAVLDRYRDDPRFRFDDDGIHGFISIKEEFYLDSATPESEKLSVRFGAAFSENDERVVTCILKDLDRLALPHQQHWASYELESTYSLDADFYAGAFEGRWTDRASIFRAFVQELVEINIICKLIGDPPLFRRDYEGQPPSGLGWMTKPTRNSFHDFALLLDKLLSDNLNKDFFRGKVDTQEEQALGGGRFKVVDLGTISLLDSYLKTQWRVHDSAFVPKVIGAIRQVRKLRQAPAHKVGDDDYDAAILKEQQDLVEEVNVAIRGLRLLLSNHPLAEAYVPPKWLQEGRIG
jgi:hypothetical protein